MNAKASNPSSETPTKVNRPIDQAAEMADGDALDLLQSREVMQEVLDLIDGKSAK